MKAKAKPIGTPIFHFGAIWIIFSRPFIVPGFEGTSQHVMRFTRRGTWQFGSICTESPPITHHHHWSPFAEYLTPKLAAAIYGVWKGHSTWMRINRNARQYRREKAWARVLRKFFAEAHALEKKWEKKRMEAAETPH